MNALLLLGGKSQRMGRDKAGIIRPDGQTQLDFLIHLCRELGLKPHLSLRHGMEPPCDLPVIRDEVEDGGPLAALSAASHQLSEEPLLVIGCDLFLLDADTLRQLIESHDGSQKASCFRNRIDGRAEPLCAIYEPEGLALSTEALGRGEYCARHFLESLSPTVLEPCSAAALDNANTPEELEEAFAKLRGGVEEKTVKVLYFAKLREERGLGEESIRTLACTVAGLYEELRFRHRLSLRAEALRAAVNADFSPWSQSLREGDEIVFIPPVAGG
jgi:molybdenum cofactor guanylyltransferase